MALYRAKPGDGIAWVTGASSGIGRALALELAAAGYTVAASARHEEELAALAREAEAAGRTIRCYYCDVTDERMMEQTVARIEDELGPIALAVLNAGVFLPAYGERLDSYPFATTFRVNVLGVVHGLVPVLDRMRERRFGHVLLTGSVTAYVGVPSAAAYGAAKAAIHNIARSLKFDLDKLNIRIQVANIGFVETPLIQRYRVQIPGSITPEEAGQRMLRGISRGGFEIAFPKRIVIPLKLLSLMPHAVSHWVLRRLTRWDERRFGIRMKKKR